MGGAGRSGDIIYTAKEGLPSSPWEHFEGLGLEKNVPVYLRYEVATAYFYRAEMRL